MWIFEVATTTDNQKYRLLQGRAARSARVAHNHEVVGSNPTPATTFMPLPVATAAKIATILDAIDKTPVGAMPPMHKLRRLLAQRDMLSWLDQMHRSGLVVEISQNGGA